MIVSTLKGFAFIHIQKAAGKSVTEDLKRPLWLPRKMGGTHCTALEGRDVLGERKWNRLYSFTFVRNPWDRMVSWWAMIDSKRGRPHGLKLWTYVQENASTFEEFLVNCTEEIHDRDGIKSLTRNQIDYCIDESGEEIVDYIGRFENFEEDYFAVLEHLKARRRPLQHITHGSSHAHYSEYYDDALRDLVGERFRRDIDRFGYQFEDGRG